MKRVVVYDVEQKKPQIKSGHSDKIKFQNKKESITSERRSRAFRTIQNASILGEIIKSIENLDLTDPSKDGPVVKDAVNKISTIIEEMKLEFKKDYWE